MTMTLTIPYINEYLDRLFNETVWDLINKNSGKDIFYNSHKIWKRYYKKISYKIDAFNEILIHNGYSRSDLLYLKNVYLNDLLLYLVNKKILKNYFDE